MTGFREDFDDTPTIHRVAGRRPFQVRRGEVVLGASSTPEGAKKIVQMLENPSRHINKEERS